MLMTISMMQQSVTDEEHQNHNKNPIVCILQNYIIVIGSSMDKNAIE
jgi:hypothetical protein